MLIHSGDALDLSFQTGYPDVAWERENVIRFYNKNEYRQSSQQIIDVRNTSRKNVKYLRIDVDWTDKFLLLNLRPETSITLYVSAPKADYCAIGVKGEFDDEVLRSENSGFEVDETAEIPYMYEIDITDSGIVVSSANLKKYVPQKLP